MDFFKKLPNSARYPIGIEWPLLKKIPLILLLGTILISAPVLTIYFQYAEISAEQYRFIYVCIGLWFSFAFFVGVIAIGCVLIMLMKGPGYVADAYELPKEDKKLESKSFDSLN
jgi:hypothetical protein